MFVQSFDIHGLTIFKWCRADVKPMHNYVLWRELTFESTNVNHVTRVYHRQLYAYKIYNCHKIVINNQMMYYEYDRHLLTPLLTFKIITEENISARLHWPSRRRQIEQSQEGRWLKLCFSSFVHVLKYECELWCVLRQTITANIYIVSCYWK